MEYKIDKEYKYEIVVEKSTFIGYFFPCNSKDEFNKRLQEIKKEHNKARHHCFAYIIDNEIKYSDDGEPQGTAGKPILGILETKNINHAGLVVVRYFGGTLLGAGRLLRTYVSAANGAVESAKLLSLVEELEIKVEIDIDYFDVFKNYLNKSHFVIKETSFNDKIEMVFFAPLNFNENLESKFYPKIKVLSSSKIKHVKEVD